MSKYRNVKRYVIWNNTWMNISTAALLSPKLLLKQLSMSQNLKKMSRIKIY